MDQSVSKEYRLFKVHVDKEAALAALSDVLGSGFINEGAQVNELARLLQPVLGSDKIVLMNSCTSTLTVALRLAQVGPGRNVVSSPVTCIASNTPIMNLGGDIRWADVDPLSGMVTADTLEAQIDENTAAVLFVDWAGVPAQLDEIDALCRRKGVKLIQDAAHAFMAEFDERPIANFADFTCYSFQAIKHFTCGDGGALVCRAQEDYERAKKLKWFGYDRDKAKDKIGNWRGQQADADIYEGEVGYKFNMNNIAAAIGLSQLPHMEDVLRRHRRNAAIYDRALDGSNAIRPIARPANCEPSFWVYTTVLTDHGIDRDKLLATLVEEGIHAGQVHVPNDHYACFAAYRRELPGVRAFSSRQISLPCGWWLEADEVRHIAKRVLTLLQSKAVAAAK